MSNLNNICTYYKSINEHKYGGLLATPGKCIKIIDLLTNERYTNGNLLNDIRLLPYGSDEYKDGKAGLSAACFSSIQDDLTCDRNDKNHLSHTGFISFDIDVDKNPYLMTDPESIRDHLIDNIPHISYIGKSVSNLGYWGLIPILNRDDHYGHYAAMKELFKAQGVIIDKTSDISRLRFIAYDPDGHINEDAKVFIDSIATETVTSGIMEYERKANDAFFIAACRWVEAKHDIQFQKGSIHNYLLYLYATLRGCHVSRPSILNWIYNNLIDENLVTTNCLDEPKWIK